ncbi:MAG: tetratricopeptide repeat protein [Myxococcota bacterium]|nr:tetratricopeptide repeat protein [Myxococcota bacterium]
MIEATCTACGTVNRVADADVPVGAKFVNCASCKSRVAITLGGGAGKGPPRGDALDFADLPAPRRQSALGGEAAKPAPRSGLAAAGPVTPAGLAAAGPNTAAGLGAAGPGSHGPTPAPIDLDHPLTEPELPVPRNKRMSTGPTSVPAGALDLDDLLAPSEAVGIADLPAPRGPLDRTVRGGADTKPSEIDLPAPRGKAQIADLPAPRPAGGRAVTDLPVRETPVPRLAKVPDVAELPPMRPPPPKAASTDLPAPRSRTPVGGVPAVSKVPDLAAARATMPAVGIPGGPTLPANLPAPRSRTPVGVPAVSNLPTDLPAPRGKPAMPDTAMPAIENLPSPKPMMTKAGVPSPAPRAPAGIVDLPTPKPGGVTDLLAPKPGGTGDLPAPKGFFDDLPQPAAAKTPSTDVAPKGFFDDLPQSASTAKQPPRSPATDVAPKGFFDDLPQSAGATKQAGTDVSPKHPSATEVAPKGFFDDLPQSAATTRQPGTDVSPKHPSATEVAPKGFFDDLPGRPVAKQPGGPPAGPPVFDDLPGRPTMKGAVDAPATPGFYDSVPQADASGGELDTLELSELSQPGIELELAGDEAMLDSPKGPSIAPPPVPAPGGQFDDLDLSSPSPVSFVKRDPSTAPAMAPSSVASLRGPITPAVPGRPGKIGGAGGDVAFELEEPRQAAPAAKLAPKRVEKAKAVDDPAAGARAKKRTKILLAAALGTAALAGGGFFMYQRHVAQEARAEALAEQLGVARKALVAGQWSRASLAANKTLELDTNNAEALGIAAESLFAMGISEGNAPARIAQGRKKLAQALEANAQHPALERAQALSPIAANQPDKAIAKLKLMTAKTPADGSLALYLGWAHAARGDHAEAITAYDRAASYAPVKVPALFSRARAKQAAGDVLGARADFAAVLDIAKDHIRAQVGLAASLPAAQSQQQEADLLAILALKDIETREPGAATEAWSLAGDAARRAGRLDVARERYRKALAITASHIESLTGLGEVELRDGKLDNAADAIGKALQQAPDDMRALLASTEIAILQKKLDEAAAKLKALSERTPPPPVVEQARLKSLTGLLKEARGEEDAAIEDYLEAARLAGDLDLTPTLKAASKLNEMAGKTKDPVRANELRTRADQLLGTLIDNAQKDPQLAMTLGMAYLEANEPKKAEPWLRKVIEQRPKDVDPQYQLAKALSLLGQHEEAIERLRRAVELDPTRSEIGLELARTYETAKPPREADAHKLYDKLLAAKEPSVELRARAGKFFARIGENEKAGIQGLQILATEPDHPAGLYLKAEGLLQANKTDEARKLFTIAADAERDAQYFDGLGRAAERWATESGDSKYQDTALRAYVQATEIDPTKHNSLIGQGRLYVLRHEDEKAIRPLDAASKIQMTAEIGYLMGKAYKALQQNKAALDWLVASMKLGETADAAWELGQIYTSAQINKPGLAAGALGTATRLAETKEKKLGVEVPWLTEALYMEGDVHRVLGNDGGARQAWEKYVQRNLKGQSGARVKDVKHFLATSLQR